MGIEDKQLFEVGEERYFKKNSQANSYSCLGVIVKYKENTKEYLFYYVSDNRLTSRWIHESDVTGYRAPL